MNRESSETASAGTCNGRIDTALRHKLRNPIYETKHNLNVITPDTNQASEPHGKHAKYLCIEPEQDQRTFITESCDNIIQMK